MLNDLMDTFVDWLFEQQENLSNIFGHVDCYFVLVAVEGGGEFAVEGNLIISRRYSSGAERNVNKLAEPFLEGRVAV